MLKFEPLYSQFGALVTCDERVDLNQIDIEQILREFKKFGLLLFRGFDISEEEFYNFSGRFIKNPQKHGASHRKKISKDGTVAEVVKGEGKVVLHRELGYTPFSPEILWFHCLIPASEGGQTTVADAREFFCELSNGAQDFLINNPIIYQHSWPQNVWQNFIDEDFSKAKVYLSQFSSIDVKNDSTAELLKFDYRVSPIKECTYLKKPIFLNSLLNIHETRHLGLARVTLDNKKDLPDWLISEIKRAEEVVTRCIQWQPHEALMLDNSRLLHGRMAFAGLRKVHTRFGNAA